MGVTAGRAGLRLTMVAALLLGALAVPGLPMSTPAAAQTAAAGGYALAWNAPQKRPTGAIAFGDANADGRLDLLVGNQGAASQVFLGDGFGGFALDAASVEIGLVAGGGQEFYANVRALAPGDVDGDGDLDLALAGDTGVLLYRNCTRNRPAACPADARFVPDATWQPGPLPGARALAWGDANGDGHLDLAVGGYEAPTRIFFNDGDGRLAEHSALPAVGSVPGGYALTVALAWGDIDGDGDLDLALGNESGPSLIYRNHGGGRLLEDADSQPLGGTSLVALAWGDLDGDGDLDLALANNGGPAQLYRNDGAGGLALDTDNPAIGAIGEDEYAVVRSLALADAEGDGDLDISLGTEGLGAFVYRNDGGGGFPPGDRLVVGGTVDSLGLAWGDGDGDGDLDLALGNFDAPSQVYRNPGAVLLRRELPEGSRSYAVALADVDADADLDLLLANQQGPSQLFRNDGAGGMALDEGNPALGQIPGGYALVTSAAWGDLEGDRDLDLVLGVAEGRSLLYRNDGAGGLSLDPATPNLGQLPNGGFANTLGVAWGDVEGDGDLDLAMAGSDASLLYRNDGGALSLSPVWAPEPSGGTALAWADVDGDTDLDLLLANQTTASRLYRNCAYPDRGVACPSGALLALDTRWTPTAADTVSVAWGDVDGDGAPDLALGNSGNPSQLFRNRGGQLVLDASWTPEPALTTGVAWVDIDLDGDLDLSMANDGQAARVYLNDGAGGLSLWPLGAELGRFDDEYISAQGLAWGDLSGDGRPDLALAGRVAFTPDLLYLSGDSQPITPGNAPPGITVAQPDTPAGTLLASARIVDTSPVSFTLRLRDREGDPVGQIGGEYSLDGGGTWSPALPADGTRTHNLATLPEHAAAPIGAPFPIPGGGSLTSELAIEPPANGTAGTLADLDLYVNIDHPAPATLGLLLRGPGGVAVPLFADVSAATNPAVRLVLDDQAEESVGAAGAALAGRFRPAIGALAAFNGRSPVGVWRLELRAGGAGAGRLLSWGLRMRHSGVAHTFAWDSFGSRFFGRSDSVLLRLTAFPAPLAGTPVEPLSYRQQAGGPVGQPFARAATQGFRGQGIQVRVSRDGSPVDGAIVFHRPAGAAQARPLTSADGAPLVTNSLGFLAGRSSPAAAAGSGLGRLEAGDQIAALMPLGTGVFSDTVERYYTSAIALDSGAPADQIQIAPGLGVQELRVFPTRPLLLFNLRVGVEWDASNDPRYREQLAFDLRRASELLYDWTDGQAALGAVSVGYGRESMERADIRVYATNRLRPNATQGGVVTDPVSETLTIGGEPRTTTYSPGTVNMGAVWTRFGGGSSFGEDWARALAHELGHYLLYLDDNYLGRDPATNALIGIPRTAEGRPCRGAMSDPYRDDFSELQPPGDEWDVDCARTLAAVEVGRADWATIKRWYDLPAGGPAPFVLDQPDSFGDRPGPAAQVLELTTVNFSPASDADRPLATPIYSLVRLEGAIESRYVYRPGSRVRAFRFSADGQQIVDLGRPTLDQIDARGARAGDSLCVYDLGAGLSGCRVLDAETSQLRLYPQRWLPDIELRPLPDSRLRLTVWADELGGAGPVPQLQATLFPGTSLITVPLELTLDGDGETYQGEFELPFPLSEGYLRLRVADDGAAESRREIVTEFVINGAPAAEGPSLQGCVTRFNARTRRWETKCDDDAPVTRSADGQMLLYADPPAEGEYYSLQTATSLPQPPAWAVAVGQPYRLVTNLDAAGLTARGGYLNAAYLESELPAGSEGGLALYYYRAAQGVWQRLPSSRFDPARNELTAPAVGDGLYALMTRVEARPGWNLVAYPWPGRLPVLSATAELNLAPGVNFVTIHAHEPADVADPWKLYDVDAPYWINDLDELEYGRGYWFIVPPDGGTPTPYLKAETAAVGAPMPPAIIYGVLRPGGRPSPATGLMVEAYSGDTFCAKDSTFAVPLGEGEPDGPQQVVFRLSIPPAGQGAPPGCGIPGQPLTVRIAGQPVGFTRWDNASPISFSATYLPLVPR